MTTKFFYANEVKEANISASSENAQYPISNLKQVARSKVFRSLSNNDYLFFDFGYPVAISEVMKVDDPEDGNKLISCMVYLDNDPAFGSAISKSMTIDSENGFSFAEFDSVHTVRYMKLVMNSASGYCEISKIFAGVPAELGPEIDISFPLSYSIVENCNIDTTRYGNRFTDEINSYRKISTSFKILDNNELDQIMRMIKAVKNSKPIWVKFDGVVNNPNELSGLYYFNMKENTPTRDTSLFWSIPIELLEVL